MRDVWRGRWLAQALQPARVLVYACLRSTQRTATELLEARRLTAPAVVVAARQTAGHGQRTNHWWSDVGSLCVTFVIPADPARPIGQIPLRAGLAVASVLTRHLSAESVRLKWPNDVLVNDRKIAGLLCARVGGADLIGLGLNVRTDLRRATPDVRARATRLARHRRTPPRRDKLLLEVWRALHDEGMAEDWYERYQRLHVLHGRRICVEEDGRLCDATCRGIDHEGRLLLEESGTLRAVTNGVVRCW